MVHAGPIKEEVTKRPRMSTDVVLANVVSTEKDATGLPVRLP